MEAHLLAGSVAAKHDILEPPSDVAIVVVTYNREAFLDRLLRSLSQLTITPRYVVVIDNASSDGTQKVVADAAGWFIPGVIVSLPQSQNTGGSGGFASGIAAALKLGVEWIWIMDDDVEALPGALEALLRWGDRYKCILGQRLNPDGSPFFFQPAFNAWLGVPLIYFSERVEACRTINAGCFEGMLVHRDIVREVGLPDPRFFQTWDDAVYGWQISRVTPVALVSDTALRRTRPQRSISLGVRHLNDASDTFRYYTMRNRALVAEHLREAGVYSASGFAMGTCLVFAKEAVRLLLVERTVAGFGALWRGWVDGQKLARSFGR